MQREGEGQRFVTCPLHRFSDLLPPLLDLDVVVFLVLFI